MTFPSSTFPRDPVAMRWSWVDPNCRSHRFPILRSSPLWEPRWFQVRYAPINTDGTPVIGQQIERRLDGSWFPPLACDRQTPRQWVQYWRRDKSQWNRRLYSARYCCCEDCLRCADAIEIMLVGIAWELAQWPDDWEHRCFHRYENQRSSTFRTHSECTCGSVSSLDDMNWQRSFYEWRAGNARSNTSARESQIDMEPTAYFTIPGDAYFTDVTITNEPITEDDIRAILTEHGWTVSW